MFAVSPPACWPRRSVAADAQVHRNFPPDTLRGESGLHAPPEVALNGQPARLAPGGAHPRRGQPAEACSAALAGSELVVHYRREPTTGSLLDVWVLNAAERANRVADASATRRRGHSIRSTRSWTKP